METIVDVLDFETIKIRLLSDNNTVWPENDHKQRTLFRSIAGLNSPEVSRYALHIIFKYGHRYLHISDVLMAYSLLPLENPPEIYLKAFQEVDWTVHQYEKNLWAILFAGMKNPESINIILSILNSSDSDTRDGILYACAAHSDPRIVRAFARIAMSTTENDSMATGEMSAFVFCFNQWLEKGIIDLDNLRRQLIEMEQPNLMSYKRLMNYIVCPNWRDLPYALEK